MQALRKQEHKQEPRRSPQLQAIKNATITITVPGQTDRDVLDALAFSHCSDLADGTYIVTSALDGGKALDVSNGSHDNGANVQLWDSNGTEAQKWTVSHDKKGYATLTNTGSGKALDVSYGKAYEEANIQQWESNDTRAQKWIAIQDGSSYTLVSALSPYLVLDVKSAEPTNGTNVQLWDSNNSKAQQWTFFRSIVTY